MRRRRTILILSTIAGALALVALLAPPRGRPAPRGPRAPADRAAPGRSPATPGAAPGARLTTLPAPPGGPKAAAPQGKALRASSAETLATVNGVAITLKDLGPYEDGAAEQALSPEEYESRLNRAVETELTIQAARAQGVELSEAQRQLLGRLREQSGAEVEAMRRQGYRWTSVTKGQTDFAARQATALLLQQDLVARAGGPGPERRDEYAAAVQRLLDQLKSDASITMLQPRE